MTNKEILRKLNLLEWDAEQNEPDIIQKGVEVLCDGEPLDYVHSYSISDDIVLKFCEKGGDTHLKSMCPDSNTSKRSGEVCIRKLEGKVEVNLPDDFLQDKRSLTKYECNSCGKQIETEDPPIHHKQDLRGVCGVYESVSNANNERDITSEDQRSESKKIVDEVFDDSN